MKSPRHVALDIIIRVETRRGHPDDLMSDAFKKHRSLTDRDRAFITELVYGTLRWQGKIDRIIAHFSRVKLPRIERSVFQILRMGVYQLLFLTRTPARAAVNESVILAKKLHRDEAAGFVNAVLRRVAREGTRDPGFLMEGRPQEILAATEAFPLWTVQKLWGMWGEAETRGFCHASNQMANLVIRANTLVTDRIRLMDRLKSEGLSVVPALFSPEGIICENPPPAPMIPFLEKGWYQIQDEAAQLIAHLVDPKPGERILDACAAPGTKTTHLGQLMENQGQIYAFDVNGARLRRVREACRRMGLTNVTVLRRDSTRPIRPLDGRPFDAVLLDAPCTGWGTIRRNPDVKWRTTPQDITRLSSLQRQMLQNVAGLVGSGGRIVYTTCTIYEEENEEVVEGFLEENRGYIVDRGERAVPATELFDHRGYFRTLPHHHGMDGFFAARLIRS
jgi:16S rRNA (cytosine967-C5)-methyltransferase